MIGLGRYFAVAGVLLVVGCGFELSGLSKSVVVGSGKVASEVRAVAGISSVSCEGSGEIELVQDGTESLKITAEDNILPYLTSAVDGGKLTLSLRKDVSIQTTKPILYKITVKGVKELELLGSGSLKATGLDTKRLKSGISGSGDMTVAGKAQREEVTISGSGSYTAPELKCTNAAVIISGSGNVVVAVSDALDANVSGSGSVEYIGSPKVTQSVAGSGSITKR
jgi:hypothetical protein